MDVKWPDIAVLNDQQLLRIRGFLDALGIDGGELNYSEYPCLLIADGTPPKYAGKMWLIKKADGSPAAFARLAYGKRVVSCAGYETANSFSNQAERVKSQPERQPNAGSIDGAFRPIYMMSPQMDIGGLAFSGNRLNDIRFVVSVMASASDPQQSLVTYEEFMAKAIEKLVMRRRLIEEAINNRPDNFEGLPA